MQVPARRATLSVSASPARSPGRARSQSKTLNLYSLSSPGHTLEYRDAHPTSHMPLRPASRQRAQRSPTVSASAPGFTCPQTVSQPYPQTPRDGTRRVQRKSGTPTVVGRRRVSALTPHLTQTTYTHLPPALSLTRLQSSRPHFPPTPRPHFPPPRLGLTRPLHPPERVRPLSAQLQSAHPGATPRPQSSSLSAVPAGRQRPPRRLD